jgi:hypothetical protein
MKIVRLQGRSSVAFAYDRHGHLFPGVDFGPAIRLGALYNFSALISS